MSAALAVSAEAQSAGFWNSLNALCGKAFEGRVEAAPAEDTTFRDKKLVMHVRECTARTIRISFFVGDDRSRTWVLTKMPNGRIRLKHDHRHKDGKPDRVTMYGGTTTNRGSAARQVFPADDQTVNVIEAAASNVWWIDVVPGESYTYSLRRMGTERYFAIRFDLKREVESPGRQW